MDWQAATDGERAWWGDCTNTAEEEAKQLKYAMLMGLDRYRVTWRGWNSPPFDLGGRSVLDIGGGPASLLLKCINRGHCAVLDPIRWPDWVHARYDAAGIAYVMQRAEGADLGRKFDEVWMYNVLPHVENPGAVCKTALRHGRIVRVFDWLDMPADKLHPHTLRQELLDRWFDVRGQRHHLAWPCYPADAYTAVIGKEMQRFHFHLLGLAHLPTRRDLSCCAYSQKIVKLARMLKGLGHVVYFYGNEGSEVECDEFISVLSAQERIAAYGDYDQSRGFFREGSGDDAAHQAFNANAVREIKARVRPRDFLLCTMGVHHKPVADTLKDQGILAVEPGVGYTGTFAEFKAFESYAWMHYNYGRMGVNDGHWYDVVIPNYFDPADFPLGEHNGDYALFVGRLIHRKGLDIAVQATREAGIRLVVAGQGSLTNPNEGLNITDSHVEHVGVVGPEERAQLMGDARMLFAPTYYIGPFEGVAVEAMMCGCPVITTDWGVFAETVLHGITGYRCRTLEQFVWAAKHVGDISAERCRDWALSNYSMDRVALMFQEWFEMLYGLWGKGWYASQPDRQQLDWLRKGY